ncbi:helix-turn-helix domain-containing protein [Streptomyces sp. NBC_00441]|uniref:Scr1 family TA system antitoxin-like transcriptional regulator n=1 Tax=Streptomyces sp. NBC_00441 TaxID=2975742 RepID=UPI002E2C85DD|nr:Scr1 family TA system antitoxin-like transcriptional regulator [Streptomyces sp. NBC_00441]
MNANNETDEHGWDVDPEDESGAAVVAAVGRQLKVWREAAGMRAAEFGVLIGYGEDLIYKVEGGRRIPRPEYLDRSDDVLGAQIQVLKFKDGTAVGRSEGAFGGRPVSDPKRLRILELRCGMIRAQALTPGESKAFIEQVLGET